LERARRLVEPPGRAEDPRADVGREAGKDGLMIFAAERHPHEALPGRRQEQRPERAVDGAVRHVEQSLPLRQRGEPAMQSAVGVESGGGAGKSLRDAIDDLLVGGHDVPFERRLRRLAMPSAALRRAAVALEPRSSPTSAYESSARYRQITAPRCLGGRASRAARSSSSSADAGSGTATSGSSRAGSGLRAAPRS